MYLPLFHLEKDFTAEGSYNPFTVESATVIPLYPIPNKYALQVTGLDAAGAVQVPTSWDVLLLASLDNLAYNEASLIVEHVNTSNGNGDVVWQNTSTKSFYVCRFLLVKVKALVLGASATRIRVSVLGDK